MSSTAEKLVYLQNGVFKRKEMSNGLQYYSDGSFSTLAIPEANGNYLLTKGDLKRMEIIYSPRVMVILSLGLNRVIVLLHSTTHSSKTATTRLSVLALKEPFHTLSTTTASVNSICRVAASTC